MAFERILVPLDGSRSAEQALFHAGRLARAFDSRMLLLRVLDTHSAIYEQHPSDTAWRLHKLEADRYIRSIAQDAQLRGIECDCYLTEGRPGEQIIQFIGSHEVDLVILSAHGQGEAYAFAFGGTAQKVASASGISCVVLRDGDRDEQGSAHYRRILVPLDGSRRAEWAIQVASMIAADAPTEVVLLEVVPVPEILGRRPLTGEETGLCERLAECNRNAAEIYLREASNTHGANLSIRTRMETSGNVASAILDVAADEDADLIVMAAHEPGDDQFRIHKSVCQSVLGRARRPVLILQHGDDRILHDDSRHEVTVLQRKLVGT